MVCPGRCLDQTAGYVSLMSKLGEQNIWRKLTPMLVRAGPVCRVPALPYKNARGDISATRA